MTTEDKTGSERRFRLKISFGPGKTPESVKCRSGTGGGARLISSLLALCLTAGWIAPVPSAGAADPATIHYWVRSNGSESGDGTKENPYPSLDKLFQALNVSSHTDDVTIHVMSNLTVYSGSETNVKYTGGTVTLLSDDGDPTTLNDLFTIKRDVNNNQSLIAVTVNNASLTLENIVLDGNNVQSTRELVQVNGTLTMENGAVIQNNNNPSSNSGGVLVNGSGKFFMEGGEITGNTGLNSGGVQVLGTFTMRGGRITGNRSITNGGGVTVFGFGSSASFTMEGGEITNNTAKNGGGVDISYVTDPAIFTMKSGTIAGNTATTNGGGVQVNYGTFTMTGGEITDNDATSGSGVYQNGTFEIDTDAGIITIKDNTGNNVYLPNNKIITLTGLPADGSQIGVTTQTAPVQNTPVNFATGTTGLTDAAISRFASDKPDYLVDLQGDTTLHLRTPHIYNSGSFDLPGKDAQINTDDVTVTLDTGASASEQQDGGYKVTGGGTVVLPGRDQNKDTTGDNIEVDVTGSFTVKPDGTITLLDDGSTATVGNKTITGPATISPDGVVNVGENGSIATNGGTTVDGPVMLLPGPNGKLGENDSNDDIVVKDTNNAALTLNDQGKIPVSGAQTVTLDKNGDGTPDITVTGPAEIAPDGTVTLEAGSTAIVDGQVIIGPAEIAPNGTVTGGSTRLPGKDNQDDTIDDVIVTPTPPSGAVSKQPDGSYDVTVGGTVTLPGADGNNDPAGSNVEVTVTGPFNVQSDGTITLPDNGSTAMVGDKNITGPATIGSNGIVSVGENGSVATTGGATVPGPALVLPGVDGNPGTTDDLVVTQTGGATLTPDSNGNISVSNGQTVTLDKGGDGTPDITVTNAATIAPDGTITLDPGSTAVVGDKTITGSATIQPDGIITVGTGGSIVKDGNTLANGPAVLMPGTDGQAGVGTDILVQGTQNGDLTPNADGTVTVTAGKTVTLDKDGDGTPDETVIGLATIQPDGTVTGGSFILPGKDETVNTDNVTVTPDSNGTATKNQNDGYDVTSGGTVKRPDGTFKVQGPFDVKPDGTITLPDSNSTVQIGNKKITGPATISPDGVVDVEQGGRVNTTIDGSSTTSKEGPVTVLPGPDGTLGGIDDVVVKDTQDTSLNSDTNGNIVVETGHTVTLDQDGDGKTDLLVVGPASISPDGVVTGGMVVLPGENTESGDKDDVTVTPGTPTDTTTKTDGSYDVTGGGTVVLPGGDGNKETDGDNITTNITGPFNVKPDGTITLPEGSTAQVGDKTVTGLATIAPDGTIDVGTGGSIAGGSVTLPGKDETIAKDDVTLTPKTPNGTATKKQDGSYDVTSGGTVVLPGADGDNTTLDNNITATVDGPFNVKPDGTITLPDSNSKVQIGDKTITGPATVSPDGTINVGTGGKIEKDGNTLATGPAVVLPGPNGQTGDGDDVIATTTDGANLTPNADGKIEVSEGKTVDLDKNGDGIPDATVVGEATISPDGTVTGGSIILPGKDNQEHTADDVALMPKPGSTAAEQADGSYHVTVGGKVTLPGADQDKTTDGDNIDVDVTGSFTVEKDGTITLDPGSTAQVGDKMVTGPATISPDGIIDVNQGGNVATGSGTPVNGHIAVLPGVDNKPGTDNDVVVKDTQGNDLTVNSNGNIAVSDTQKVTLDKNGDGTTDSTVDGPAEVTPDGTIKLDNGGTATVGDKKITGPATVGSNGIIEVEQGGNIAVDGNSTPVNGPALVLPGVDGTPGTTDDLVVTETGGATLTPDNNGNTSVSDGQTVTLDKGGDGTTDITITDSATIAPDGTITLDPGSTAKVGDKTITGPATISPDGVVNVETNGKIDKDGTTVATGPAVLLPGSDGQTGTADDVIVTTTDGVDLTPDSNGNISVPADKTVDLDKNGDGTPDVSVAGPATIAPDGTVSGGSINLPGKDTQDGTGDDVTVTPNAGSNAVEQPNGSYKVTDGGTVVLPGKDQNKGTDDDITVDVTGSFTVQPDGTINLPENSTAKVGDKMVTGPATISPDGVIDVNEGGSVATDGSTPVNGHAVVLPGVDGKPGTSDDVIATDTNGADLTPNSNGTVTVSAGQTVDLDQNGDGTPDLSVKGPATIYPNGVIDVNQDGSIANKDGDTTVTGTATVLPGADGKLGTNDDVVVTEANGADLTPDSNGNIPVAAGQTANLDKNGDGMPDVSIPGPALIGPDGNLVGNDINLPGKDAVDGTADDVTLTTNPGSNAEEKADGSYHVTNGGTVTLPGVDGNKTTTKDNTTVAVDGPFDVKPDGTITLPDNGSTAKVGDKTITGSATIAPSGVIEVDAGGSVATGGGTPVAGPAVVLPGLDGQPGTADDVVATDSDGAPLTPDANGNISVSADQKVNLDLDGDGTPDAWVDGPATIYPSGVVDVNQGGTLTKDDGTTVDGSKVVLPGADGQPGTGDDVTVTDRTGADLTPDSNGNIPVSAGQTVDLDLDGDGTPDRSVEGPATIYPSGVIDVSNGGSITEDGAPLTDGPTVVLPGPDGQMSTGDDVVVTETSGAELDTDNRGNVVVSDTQQVTLDKNGDGTPDLTVDGPALIAPDGTVTLPAGGIAEVGDKFITGPATIAPNGSIDVDEDGSIVKGDGTTVDGSAVVLPGPDGKPGTSDDVIATERGGADLSLDKDGNLPVPAGQTVTLDKNGDGMPDVSIPGPALIGPDGNLVGNDINLPGKDTQDGTADDVTLTPNPGSNAEEKADGSYHVTNGGTVTLPGVDGDKTTTKDNTTVAVDGPFDVKPDGTITLPDNGSTAEVGNKTITGPATIAPSGVIEVGTSGSVATGGGTPVAGPAVVLPGLDGQPGTADDVVATDSDGAPLTPDANGNISVSADQKVNLDLDGDGTPDAWVDGPATIYPSGVVDVNQGGTLTKDDGTTVTGSKVVLPGADGQPGTGDDVTVTDRTGADLTPDSNGNIPVSAGQTVDIDLDGDGTPDRSVEGPATIYPNGVIDVSNGGSITEDGVTLTDGPTVVLPGPDGQMSTGDDVVVTETSGAELDTDNRGNVVVSNTQQVTLDKNGDGTPDLTVDGPALIAPDGTVTLPAGSTAEVGDKTITGPATIAPNGVIDVDAGGNIATDGSSTPVRGSAVVLPGPDGKPGTSDDVIATERGGADLSLDKDGNLPVPAGQTVTLDKNGDGTPDVSIPGPALIGPDGNLVGNDINLPGKDAVDGTADDVTLTPNPGSNAEEKADGSYHVTNGGTVTLPGVDGDKTTTKDNTTVAVDGPFDVKPDGTITLPDNGSTAEVGDKTITGPATIAPSGVIEVDAGGSVATGGGTPVAGPAVVLPGLDGQPGTADDVVATDSNGAPLTPDANGNISVSADQKVNLDLDGDGTPDAWVDGPATIYPSGVVDVNQGGTLTKDDGTTVTGPKVVLPGADGQPGTGDDVTVTDRTGADLTPDSNGNIPVSAGQTVDLDLNGDGTPDLSVNGPATIYPSGVIDVDAGGSIIKDGATIVTGPAVILPGPDGQMSTDDDIIVSDPDGDELVTDYRGNVLVSGAQTVNLDLGADGTHDFAVVGSAVIGPDGSVTGGTIILPVEPEDMNDDVQIVPDTGNTVHKNENGHYTVTGSGTVQRPDGAFVMYNLFEVQEDGTITVPRGSSVRLPATSAAASIMRDVEGPVVIYPDGKIAYTVTVNGSYATSSGTDSYKNGEEVKIHAGSRSGYTFTGWTSNDVVITNASSADASFTMPYKHVTVTANWRASGGSSSGGGGVTTNYTLTFSTNGGSAVAAIGKPSGTKIALDQVTTREGYIFTGWYLDSALTEKATSVTLSKDTTVYAGWTKAIADPADTGVSKWLNTDEHIQYLSGYGGDVFGANDRMTRAQVAQMFYNLLLDKNVTISTQFSDVADDAWYAQAVNVLMSLGFINGYGNGTFGPEDHITRAQFTAIATRFAKLDATSEITFSDVSKDEWYYENVATAVKYGWVNGYSDGTFRPDATITRAEVTAIVNRLLGRSADVTYINTHADSLKKFSDVLNTDWFYYDIMEATNGHGHGKNEGMESWTELK